MGGGGKGEENGVGEGGGWKGFKECIGMKVE
jgi:hypothetical protein